MPRLGLFARCRLAKEDQERVAREEEERVRVMRDAMEQALLDKERAREAGEQERMARRDEDIGEWWRAFVVSVNFTVA